MRVRAAGLPRPSVCCHVGEFEPGAETRAELLAHWEASWQVLYETLQAVREEDLQRTVQIRNEPHTALQALLRGLGHATYHVGQILYIARWFNPHAAWLTIPPRKSQDTRPGYLAADVSRTYPKTP